MSTTQDRPAQKYLLLGAGGHAASVGDVVTAGGGEVTEFVGPQAEDSAIARARDEEIAVVPAIGENHVREKVMAKIEPDVLARAIVAPSATVSDPAAVGAGSVVHHHAHVGPRTKVGSGAIINTGAIVEHDCLVGDFVHVAPGAVVLGGVRIGDRVLLGAGCRVLPGITIESDAVVGAGSVVVSDVRRGTTVVGVPACERRGTAR